MMLDIGLVAVLNNSLARDLLLWLGGVIITVSLSGVIVRFVVERTSPLEPTTPSSRYDIGAIIGKCENILTVTFVLADAITGLALLFTGKSIVRSEDIKKDPRYYLGGTLVNFTFSVVVAVVLRMVMRAL